MNIWSRLKSVFSKTQETKSVAKMASDGQVPCFVCSTSFDPGSHSCTNQTQSTDLYSRFLTTRKALRELVVAIETDTLTQDVLDRARKALKLV